MNGKNLGAAVLGGLIVLAIYHIIFVRLPFNEIKSKIGAVDKFVASKADSVRRNLGAMESGVAELNQRVSMLEDARDLQAESLTKISTALEDVKMAAMKAQAKFDLAVGLSKKSRDKTAKGSSIETKRSGARKRTTPATTKSEKSKLAREAKSDTLFAKLLERQNELFEQVENINKRLNAKEGESEAVEEGDIGAEKEDSAKNRARLSSKAGKIWKNSFAF